MPANFLENVADYLYNQYRDKLGDSVIVFPGRRAAVFFKKYIVSITDKTIWAPRLLTMSDFFREQSNLLLTDDLKLLFLLYKIYSEETKSQETFDQFYYWGSMLLNDFDDIDKYLADATQIFSNIESLKEIDQKFDSLSPDDIRIIKQFWTNFNPEQDSFHKQEFIKIWKALTSVYSIFRKNLLEQNQGYEGMIFRQVAEKIKQNEGSVDLPWDKVFFVGLNALTPCENTVMKALQRSGKAEFFWDYDKFYLDKVNEAGLFMNENIRRFPPPDFNNTVNNFSIIPKKIKVLSVASNIGQAKNIYRALEEMEIMKEDEKIESCIVLGDENLLIPTLYSIPEKIQKVNVTMGYPLNSSTIFHFIRLLSEMYQLSKPSGKKEIVFYYQTVLAVLSHQYLSFWEKDVAGLKQYITDKNIIYITSRRLQINPYFEMLFQNQEGNSNFSEYLLKVLYEIILKMSEGNILQKNTASIQNDNQTNYIQTSLFDTIQESPESGNNYFDIEKEFIYQAYLIIKRLNSILDELHIQVETPTYLKMLNKALQTGKVNFIGEPLAGLQVMGVLETRALDFKNLIITSMNEGIFPKKTTSVSFIPYNLRRAFNLPTYEHQDAIYAYYFYRLLQRSENIYLIYNSNTEGLNGGEMSRFIYQLLYTSNIPVELENIEYHIKGNKPVPVRVAKNAVIQTVLNKYVAGTGNSVLSPSAINYFKNCSLRFYFRYIAGLKEPEEVQEDIDFALFGDILHLAMKLIYSDFNNEEITHAMLEKILHKKDIIETAIDNAFAIKYFKDENADNLHYTGKNIIIREVIKKYVIGIIKNDLKTTPFRIISLEKEYHTTFSLFGGKTEINIGGTIDRVDEHNGTYRIIDYKTGRKHNHFRSMENLFFPEKKGETDAIAQVFMYSLFFNKLENKDKKPVLPSLAYLREIYLDDFSMMIKQKGESRKYIEITSFQDYEKQTEELLTALLEQLFAENTDFVQTDDLDYCKNCAYREICHR